jgi:UDP-glucose 4-epimerase
MRILFTGASSFTGHHFATRLAAAGHDVTAIFRAASADAYTEPIRRARVRAVADKCRPVWSCAFGDESFIRVVRDNGPWDVLCHHAADVSDYKSPDFDAAAALAANTRNLRPVLAALRGHGCRRALLTGSVFEGGEGAGSDGLPHFSPYGLSKALTAQAFAFYCREAGLHLGKFVIPNPFGPFEEPRFTAYLIRTWREGKVAAVNTPDYVRDNIHVDLLAQTYRLFIESLPDDAAMSRLNPSGYVESQGAFAQRFAREMGPRLGMGCELDMRRQTNFAEPRVRINTDPAAPMAPDWSEAAAWDALAAYYQAGQG